MKDFSERKAAKQLGVSRAAVRKARGTIDGHPCPAQDDADQALDDTAATPNAAALGNGATEESTEQRKAENAAADVSGDITETPDVTVTVAAIETLIRRMSERGRGLVREIADANLSPSFDAIDIAELIKWLGEFKQEWKRRGKLP